MFVRSLMQKDVTYHKSGKSWVIKAGTTTLIDDCLVSAKELKSLYGDRIIVAGGDYSKDEVAPRVKKSITVKPETKKEEKVTVNKKPVTLDEKLIDDIIAQIEEEEKDKNKPVEKKEDKLVEVKTEPIEKKEIKEEKPVIAVTKVEPTEKKEDKPTEKKEDKSSVIKEDKPAKVAKARGRKGTSKGKGRKKKQA